MDDERHKKIQKGQEKLVMYKKKKSKMKGKNSSGSNSANESSSDSLSLSPDILPETNMEKEESDTSTISEHIGSVQSIENDRSIQEIEIDSIMRRNSDERTNISQEKRPSLATNSYNSDKDAEKNAKSILDELIQHAVGKTDDISIASDDTDLNIFDNLNFDDSSINNYVSRLKTCENDDNEVIKGKNVEDLPSNQSTFSINTTITEYKQFENEYINKIVEYQDALTANNVIIKQLTESLEKEHEKDKLCEQYVIEITTLQSQLQQLREYMNKSYEKDSLNTNISEEEKHISEKSEKDVRESLELDAICSQFTEVLNPEQSALFNAIKCNIVEFMRKEIESAHALQRNLLKTKFDTERNSYKHEIHKLRELLAKMPTGMADLEEVRKALEGSHQEEMSQQRIYYEGICKKIKEEYSEEINSSHSRKLSGSSTDLESERIFEVVHPLGPGGDAPAPDEQIQMLTKSDLLKFRKQIDNAANVLTKYNLAELSDADFDKIKSDLSVLDLTNLLNVNLAAIRNDARNKYNAELEILREDHEHKLDELNLQYENEKVHYEEENDALKCKLSELETSIQTNVKSAVQELADSTEYEFFDIVKTYQIQLQDQVELAKEDIYKDIMDKIERLADDPITQIWSDDLLKIRDKFTEKYENEIADLKQQHVDEISRIKDEHLRNMNSALERARRRSSSKESASSDVDIIRERNSLRRASTNYKFICTELFKYLTQCEVEINNTLVDSFIKNNTILDLDDEFNESTANESTLSKRVHVTPNVIDFLNILETNDECKDISVELRNELDMCLERLKSEANALLALTDDIKTKQVSLNDDDDKVKSLEEKVTSLTRQLVTDSQIKEELGYQLAEAQQFVTGLENERVQLERTNEELMARNRILDEDLTKARGKIDELIECCQKEIISEGYGVNNKLFVEEGGLGARANLADLQEKARLLATESTSKQNDPLIGLIEEFCRASDCLMDEAKVEQEDYRQQIESADKKLRANTQFLEQQAMEREQEREEAQKEIVGLQEQLREREKELSNYERISKEVEQLELQMREMTKLIEDGESKYVEADNERKEAVEKIQMLRDIIQNLETQVDAKTRSEAELKDIISQLQEVIKEQRKAYDALTVQLEADTNSANFRQHIVDLEEEVRKLRLTSELAGNETVLKQIQLQLHDIELTIDKSTVELEALHSTVSLTSCSSPSEEMSIRDQIRPQTPNSTLDECEIPLQQLARLKEKLIKHSRAEHAAIKKIQDLEMQLVTSKHENDELQNERDVLQEQVNEQLVLISSLQLRLDDQRIRAEHIQKQTNASLEVRIYELENEIQALKDTLHTKESAIKQLNRNIEQTMQRLNDREKELVAALEDNTIVDLQSEIVKLKNDNDFLRTRIESDAQNAQILPNIVDNIIAEKNRTIDELRHKLSETTQFLDLYKSLDMKHRSEDDSMVSFVNLTPPDQLRRASGVSNLELSDNSRKMVFEPEMSSIAKIGSPNLIHTIPDVSLMKPNSTEIHQKTADKHVHFEDTDASKESAIKIADLEREIEELMEVKETLAQEQDVTRGVKADLAQLKMRLEEKESVIEALQEDSKRKDDMYFKLAKEKRDIEKELKECLLKMDKLQGLVEEFEGKHKSLSEEIKNIDDLNGKIANLIENERKLKQQIEENTKCLHQKDETNNKLEKEIANKSKQLKAINDDITQLKDIFENKIVELQNEIAIKTKECNDLLKTKNSLDEEFAKETKRLKNLLIDRECEIEILNEDIKRYQNDIDKLELQIKSKTNDNEQLVQMKQRKEIAEKELEIVKLNATIGDLKMEIIHLQDYLSEKDKIIDQMKADSESLKVNLETIKMKLHENGNVFDLREKLQREQEKNVLLRAELNEKQHIDESMDEISEKVKKQLDYSIHLDEAIINAINSPDFASEFDIEMLRNAIKQERSKNKQLVEGRDLLEKRVKAFENESTNFIETIKQLRMLVDNERKKSNEIQIEDANLIEQMRLRLEAALESENEFEAVLEQEKKRRNILETEISVLRQKMENLSSSSSKTEYKSLPDTEATRLKQELQLAYDTINSLKKDVKTFKRSKGELEANLKYTKDLLNLKTKEIEELEKRIHDIQEEGMKFKENYVETKTELEQRSREVENSRSLLAELEQEKLELVQKINRMEAVNLESTIPDKFLQKMNDLGELVSQHIKENQYMADSISKLTRENEQLKADLQKKDDLHHPFDDPVARANHLFGKYLRADSYRRALAWQKKYFIRLLITYQHFGGSFNNDVLHYEPKYKKPVTIGGKRRFRAVACVLVAIFRMKFMVQRWHSGTRCGTYLSHQRNLRNAPPNLSQHFTTHFQIGQPVSSQNFNNRPPVDNNLFGLPNNERSSRTSAFEMPRVNTPPLPPDHQLPPWSGSTPPSKDRTQRTLDNNTIHTVKDFSTTYHPPDLSKYFERFNMIQQRLGMAIDSHNNV